MGFFDRLSRLFRANLNDLVGRAEDPVKILEQSVEDMQADLVKLRQAVSMAISSQKRLQSQADQSNNQISTWYERAELALQKGEETLAKEALTRRKAFQESAKALTDQLQAQEGQVEMLKRSLVVLEGKIATAKTKKDMLKARAQAAQAQQDLQSAVGSIGANSAMAAFERMEDKVEALEASSQASAELAGADLESKFAALEGQDDLEDELNLIRQKLQGDLESISLPALEQSQITKDISEDSIEVESVKVEEVDADLEALKRSLKNLEQ